MGSPFKESVRSSLKTGSPFKERYGLVLKQAASLDNTTREDCVMTV